MKRPLFYCGCVFGATAAVLFYLGFFPAISLAAVMAAGGLLPFRGPRRPYPLIFAAVMAAAIALYGAYFSLCVLPVTGLAGQSCHVTVSIMSARREGSYTLAEGMAKITATDNKEYKRVGVRLNYYGENELIPGESLSFTAVARPVSIYPAALASRMADGLFLSFNMPAVTVPVTEPPYPMRAIISRLRHRIAEGFIYGVGGDAGALLSSLITGSRQSLSMRAEGELSRGGLMHITAVSGLHVSIIAMAAAALLGKRRRKLGYIIGGLLGFWYAGLAGFSPSALRAAVMFGLVALAQSFGRRADGLTSLSVAAMLLIISSPLSVGDLGLQLSFLAALGILTITPRLRAVLRDLSISRTGGVGIFSPIIDSVAASVGAMIYTAPLTALYFGYLPLLGVLANLAVVMALPLILGLAGIGALGFIVTPGGFSLLYPLLRLMAGLPLGAARLFGGLPFSALYIKESYELVLLTAFCAAGALLIWQRPGRRVILAAICCAAVATGSSFIAHSLIYKNTVELIMFGDSDCAAYTHGGEAVLLNLPADGYDIRRVAALLERRGVRRIALLTAENPQSVRIMGERIPINLCRTGAGALPLGAEALLPNEPVNVNALGLNILIDEDGSAHLPHENKSQTAPNYAIIAKSGHRVTRCRVP